MILFLPFITFSTAPVLFISITFVFVQSFSRAPLKIRAMNKENGNKHRLKLREPFARGKVDKGILVERNWLIRRTINAPYIGEQRAINRCTRNWTKRGKRQERLSSFHPHRARNPCFRGIRESCIAFTYAN